MNITIVGAGLMGSATAYPLSDNGHHVRLVGTHLDAEIIKSCKENHYHPRLKRKLPPGIQSYFVEELGEALEGAEIIVSGVNSLGAHWIGQALAPHIHAGQTIIAITKGLEADAGGNLMILPEVLRSELPQEVGRRIPIASVGGPCIAGELAGRRQSCVVFGCEDPETVARLAKIFRTAYYHIWTTTDLVGLEYGAALKNAYALAVGLAAGLLEKGGGTDPAGAHMHNLAAAIFAQSVIEIERMLEVAGASRAFAFSLPGAGDLYVTSAGGRTMRLGRLLGAGNSYSEARKIMAGETLESVEIIRMMGAALPRLCAAGVLKPDELPLMRKLVDIIVGGQAVELPLEEFFGGRGCL